MSVVTEENRLGRITSSEIFKIIPYGSRKMTEKELAYYKARNPKGQKKNIDAGFRVGGETYLRHKKQERKRKRSMDVDVSTRVMAWGKFMEQRVFNLMENILYKSVGTETKTHPKYPNDWAGTVDFIIPSVKVSEVKAYQPDNFCDYADCLLSKDIDRMREDFPMEYWQIVSNACIHDVTKGEAILYMPYDSEAEDIMEMVDAYDGPDIWQYKYIYDEILSGNIHRLPFQPDESDYPNLIVWEFEVPEDSKAFLEERVCEAVKYIDELK